MSAETGLLKEWPAERTAAGVADRRAPGKGIRRSRWPAGGCITLGARQGTEYVLAFDAASGKRLWEVANGRRFNNDRGDGPRSTPTVDGDRVYVFGSSGDMTVLDAATGKVFWTQNLLQKYGGSNIQWGLSESPLVLSDRIIVTPGGSGAAIVALQKTDGSLIWKIAERRAGILVGACCTRSATCSRRSCSPASARSASTSTTAGCCGATTASPIAPPTSRRRSRGATASSCRPTTERARRCWRSAPTATGSRRREVYFTNDMRNHHASSVLVG